MRDHTRRRLHLLDRDIESTGAALAMARERLAALRADLEESRMRMLIAETPLADRDLHAAARAFAGAQHAFRELEAELEALRSDRRVLSSSAERTGV